MYVYQESVEAVRAATDRRYLDMQEKMQAINTTLSAKIRELQGELSLRSEEFKYTAPE